MVGPWSLTGLLSLQQSREVHSCWSLNQVSGDTASCQLCAVPVLCAPCSCCSLPEWFNVADAQCILNKGVGELWEEIVYRSENDPQDQNFPKYLSAYANPKTWVLLLNLLL